MGEWECRVDEEGAELVVCVWLRALRGRGERLHARGGTLIGNARVRVG